MLRAHTIKLLTCDKHLESICCFIRIL